MPQSSNPEDEALTFNCPHIGRDRWGCAAVAGSECDWEHDGPADPGEQRARFHAERIMLVPGLGNVRIPKETIDRVADEFV